MTVSALNLNSKKSIDMWVGKAIDWKDKIERISWVEQKGERKILKVFFNSEIEANLISRNRNDLINDI